MLVPLEGENKSLATFPKRLAKSSKKRSSISTCKRSNLLLHQVEKWKHTWCKVSKNRNSKSNALKVDHNKSPNKPRYNLQLVVLLCKWYNINCEVSLSGSGPGSGLGSGSRPGSGSEKWIGTWTWIFTWILTWYGHRSGPVSETVSGPVLTWNCIWTWIWTLTRT